MNIAALLAALLLLATLPASAQAPATITCPTGTVPNPSYAASPLMQGPCMAAPIYMAPPPSIQSYQVVPVAPSVQTIDPNIYWLQQQQLQQQQEQLQRQRWQWEHMQQHPELYPGHPH